MVCCLVGLVGSIGGWLFFCWLDGCLVGCCFVRLFGNLNYFLFAYVFFVW